LDTQVLIYLFYDFELHKYEPKGEGEGERGLA